MAVKPKVKYLFDLHCDTLTEIEKYQLDFSNYRTQLSLRHIPENYHICQCMAVFIPDKYRGPAATAYFERVYQYYLRQLQKYKDCIVPLQYPAEAGEYLKRYQLTSMLTVEGGAVLAGRLESLYRLYKYGVKMITLTWNGANELCGGASTDQGFTAFGRQAVALMEDLDIVVDVSHLSDRGFHELCDFARRPFVASHSNARAVCNHPRNLTDGMFCEICNRKGLVGLNYYRDFILEGGGTKAIDDLLRHVHHFLDLGGENILALGSDFDGADMPKYLEGIQAVPFLREALERSGIPEAVVDNIFYGNAQRFFASVGSRKASRN